ncbi:nitroreductase family protein [Microbacterium sp.]|uniref:nitroreductase family protein n=1 Tax=Microbacterium sp. TaxID=51671 RepID=UPI0039E2661D
MFPSDVATTTPDYSAQLDAPILDVLKERWSPSIFDPEAVIDEADLASALEAARWAPSADNHQPTRFIVARRGTKTHEIVFDALMSGNQRWARAASMLIVILTELRGEDGKPRKWAYYDAGQAAAHFTIQAHARDLAAHQMGGFDPDAIRQAFGIDERFCPVAVIALGRHGDIEKAPDELRSRPKAWPRKRRAAADSVLVND